MKTQKFNPMKAAVKTSLLIMVVMVATIASCQTKGTADKGGKKVSAPQVDIHTAIVTDNVEALKQHIAAGSDINEKDPFGGSSPLISASLFGKTEMAKILIDAGADINFQNNDGSTALHTSSFFCNPEIVRMLLTKGADKSIRNKFGSTAYESVAGSFAEVKPVYEMMQKMLGPSGLKMDFAYIQKTRPEIASMLK